MIPHFLSEGGRVDTITVFNPNSDKPVLTADSNHPHWDDILFAVASGDESVYDLFDVAGGVMKRFQQVTDRVSWSGSEVLWDGDPVHSVLSDQLARAIQDGNVDNYEALAKFWEKLESNPNAHSREQAYSFLATHSFQITQDGDVVGYKGVTQSYNAADGTDVYHSAWSSQVPGVPSAYVNGVAIKPMAHVPQAIGDVVSMPRSEVVHDPSQACRRGLHVATRSYAGAYGTVLEVHFNPRDICSVPDDARGEKVRVNRYKVARVASEVESTGPVLRENTYETGWSGDVGYKV